MMLLIYLPEFSARSEYVFNLIFKYESGIKYHVTTDLTEFQNYSHEKINYSSSRIENEFFQCCLVYAQKKSKGQFRFHVPVHQFYCH